MLLKVLALIVVVVLGIVSHGSGGVVGGKAALLTLLIIGGKALLSLLVNLGILSSVSISLSLLWGLRLLVGLF